MEEDSATNTSKSQDSESVNEEDENIGGQITKEEFNEQLRQMIQLLGYEPDAVLHGFKEE